MAQTQAEPLRTSTTERRRSRVIGHLPRAARGEEASRVDDEMAEFDEELRERRLPLDVELPDDVYLTPPARPRVRVQVRITKTGPRRPDPVPSEYLED